MQCNATIHKTAWPAMMKSLTTPVLRCLLASDTTAEKRVKKIAQSSFLQPLEFYFFGIVQNCILLGEEDIHRKDFTTPTNPNPTCHRHYLSDCVLLPRSRNPYRAAAAAVARRERERPNLNPIRTMVDDEEWCLLGPRLTLLILFNAICTAANCCVQLTLRYVGVFFRMKTDGKFLPSCSKFGIPLGLAASSLLLYFTLVRRR